MNALRRFFSLFNILALILLAAAAYALQVVQRPQATPQMPKLEMAELHPVKLTVYYSDSQVQNMKPVVRTVQVTEESAGVLAQAAADAWAAGTGSKDSDVLPVVPKNTPAPRIYVRGLHYYADLPAAYTKLNYGSSGERMLLCTLTRTLLDKRDGDVTFLVNGQSTDTLGHLDLQGAYTRQDCQN
ncbi:GerMN domain-containing protein [Deinococcus sp.]|uniref:GerMN domain-containing protein n=1 Tax=Deinococcus sp. TaxID=47478 RepID=UPI0025BA2565|nr:GerMN domain-containing protein [Deinococcus sp.]